MRLRGVRCRAVPEAFGCAGGGATTAWRLNDKTLSQLGRAGGGAKDEKFDADRGFSPPRVQLSPHSCDLKLSRACSSCRAAYAYPQRGPKAQHSTGEAKHQPPAHAHADARRRSVYEEALAIRNVGS